MSPDVDARGVSVNLIQASFADGTVVNVPGGIKTVKAGAWTGGGINAGWIGAMTLGRKGVDATFNTPVTLTGDHAPDGKPVLGRAKVFGSLTAVTWTIAGPAGPITVTAAATNFTLADYTALKMLAVGEATGVDADGSGAIGSIRAASWTGGTIVGDSIATLNVRGDFLGAVVNVDNAGAVAIAGDMSGTWTGLTIRSLVVKGDLTTATVTLAEPVTFRRRTLGRLVVGGWLTGSLVRSAGHVGAVAVGGLTNSTLLAGLRSDYTTDTDADGVLDLTAAPADYAEPVEPPPDGQEPVVNPGWRMKHEQ